MALLSLLRPSGLNFGGTGILTCCPFDYAFRPRLRPRLTLGGMTLPRKPWVYGEGDSHPLYRYSYWHNHFHAVQLGTPAVLTLRLHPAWNAPLPLNRFRRTNPIRGFGTSLESRLFRRGDARLVSYYALFKWWLLPSQHPSCLSILTSFVQLRYHLGTLAVGGLFPSRRVTLAPHASLLVQCAGIRSSSGVGRP